MPGRHITVQQMRLFMTLRQTQTIPLAAATAGDSWVGKGDNNLLFGSPGGRQEPPQFRHRAGTHRERLPRALHPHNQSGPEALTGPARLKKASPQRSDGNLSVADSVDQTFLRYRASRCRSGQIRKTATIKRYFPQI